MTLPRLMYGNQMVRPVQDDYSAPQPYGANVTDIAGGFARVAADTVGNVYQVTATYRFNELEYLWWGGFYHTTLLEGAMPFVAELALDTPVIQEYTCQIVARPSNPRNLGFYTEVTLTLQAEPIIDHEYNAAMVTWLSAFGDDSEAAFLTLERMTNEGVME